jgi:hypothetical protein
MLRFSYLLPFSSFYTLCCLAFQILLVFSCTEGIDCRFYMLQQFTSCSFPFVGFYVYFIFLTLNLSILFCFGTRTNHVVPTAHAASNCKKKKHHRLHYSWYRVVFFSNVQISLLHSFQTFLHQPLPRLWTFSIPTKHQFLQEPHGVTSQKMHFS